MAPTISSAFNCAGLLKPPQLTAPHRNEPQIGDAPGPPKLAIFDDAARGTKKPGVCGAGTRLASDSMAPGKAFEPSIASERPRARKVRGMPRDAITSPLAWCCAAPRRRGGSGAGRA